VIACGVGLGHGDRGLGDDIERLPAALGDGEGRSHGMSLTRPEMAEKVLRMGITCGCTAFASHVSARDAMFVG
jgi:hypothetical protein